ncbi:MAG: TetR/AcrR family transcriptional regulator [Oscillospiraceae bacterium]|jgi:AcrR family transcriptional regulator|nr:TetR/AcrR family transcriptional regulator [Oscillospiraceae bacterium]
MAIDASNFSVFSILGNEYNLPIESGARGTKENILLHSTILFAMYGYAAVSVKDIAAEIGVQPASLYYHFPSKDALWRAVVDQTEKLYRLYHDELEKVLMTAESMAEVLEIIFREPERMSNNFTCFAFSLIQSEQFRDEYTWGVYRDTFCGCAVAVYTKCFNRCIELGYVKPFDVEITAAEVLVFVLQQVCMTAQSLMGRELTHDPREQIRRYRAHLLHLLASDEHGV